MEADDVRVVRVVRVELHRKAFGFGDPTRLHHGIRERELVARSEPSLLITLLVAMCE